jgi:kinesin family protein 18/19
LEVFEKTTRFLLEGVVNGFNATVFAYGATGAGKTHTMLGTVDHPGIMLLTIRDLFGCINRLKAEREFQVKLSYLEIYNEQCRDLINVNSDILDIRDDPVRGNVVAGISEMLVTSPDEIMQTLRTSNKNRTQEPT